jgi:uncharacterized iron-regulated membrane protein
MRPPRKSRWPKPPSALVARMLASHSIVGLAFGALIYLICLTGAVAVFVDELTLIEAPGPAVTLQPGALDRAARDAVAALGGPGKATTLYILAATTPNQRWMIHGGDHQWRIGQDGALTPFKTPWIDFVTGLHMNLALPGPWGSVLVGIIGAGLFALIVSGVLAHPRILRDAFALRLGGTRRLQEADLHNRLSVWGLPFHVVVTLTGAFFGLSNVALMAVAAIGFQGDIGRPLAVLRGPPQVADARMAPLPPLEPLVAQARALRPGSQLSYIGLDAPGTRGARITVEVTAPGRLPRGEEAYFDQAGRMVGRGRFASGAAGLQVYAGAAQVHFGFFGGLPVRIAYGVLGAGLTYVSATGMSIWLARRRDRGQPAPRLERAWAGWTWGALGALAAAALASRIAPPAWVFWGLALAIQAAVQLWPRTRRFDPRPR